VRIEEDPGSGRKCRVLGKSGVDLGGATLDQWLYQEVLRQNHRQDFDQSSRRASRQLLAECERIKELLSEHETASFAFVAQDGVEWRFELSRARFEELLEEKEAFRKIDQSIRRALNAARERGYDEDQIHSAIMVGGTSHIPAIQKAVQRIFGRERTHLRRPLDAVARGAAAFVSGVDFFDHIQHDYAIKYLNPSKGDYDYKVLVKKGTAYPTSEPLARLTVKSTFAGQTQMGVAIYEMGQSPKGETQPFELVFDPSGAARVMEVSADDQVKREMFWINENAPTFLPADPPAVKGEARFEVEFNIDANKRLLISARDLKTGSWAYRNFPMIKLS
jgi:molecular chaperone DnaK